MAGRDGNASGVGLPHGHVKRQPLKSARPHAPFNGTCGPNNGAKIGTTILLKKVKIGNKNFCVKMLANLFC